MSRTYTNLTTCDSLCCGICAAPVALTVQIGGDLTYECSNRRCQKVVSVDCPEALGLMTVITFPTRVAA
jgi:hypothetical protein